MNPLDLAQKGFSLVQGMILSGVLAGSALVATKMIAEQKKVQRSTETRDQIEDLHNIVYSALQNRKNCEQTIIAAGAESAIIAPGLIPLNEIRTDNAANPIVVKKFTATNDPTQLYMNGNVIIKDISLSDYDAVNGSTTLSILYERMAGVSGTNPEFKRTKDGYGAKDIRKTISLRVQRHPFTTGKPFESCYATTDNTGGTELGNKNLSRKLCEEMNGGFDLTDAEITKSGGDAVTGQKMWIWDESAATCLPNAKCPSNQIYTGIDSTGDVKCRTLNSWGLETLIEPMSVGNCTGVPGKQASLKYNPVTKKVQIVCGAAMAVDCSSYETPFTDVSSSGCIENVVPSTGLWSDVSAQCECQDIQGTYFASCNLSNPGGTYSAVTCRPK